MAFPKYSQLPPELRLQVIEETLDSAPYIGWPRRNEPLKHNISPYACVDQEWNRAVELRLFRCIKIGPGAEELDELGAICSRRSGRLSRITLRFSDYMPPTPGYHRRLHTLFALFEIMKNWNHGDREQPGLVQLRLDFECLGQNFSRGPEYPCDLARFPEVPVIGSIHELVPSNDKVPIHPRVLASLYQKLPNIHHASLTLPSKPSDYVSTQDVINAMDSLQVHKPKLTHLDLRAGCVYDLNPQIFSPTLLPIMGCLNTSPSTWTDRLVSLKVHHTIVVPEFLREASKAIWPNLKTIELVGVMDVRGDGTHPASAVQRAVAEETCSSIIEALAMVVPSMPKATTFQVRMIFNKEFSEAFKISMRLGNFARTDKAVKMLPCGDKFVPDSNNGVAKAVGIYLSGLDATNLQDVVRCHRRQELEVFSCTEDGNNTTTTDDNPSIILRVQVNSRRTHPTCKSLDQFLTQNHISKMHLMCNVDPASGKRTYTLKKVLEGKVTKSAHPARFSPDDKWSKHRNLLRKRFGRLPQGL
ncbi:hypothetical protein INS49_015789 [Diaporthe citri]|uniref:uncharacterized protein n=1 Tax=Diaporthe citri TaxID=83186 RepID=UPI001C8194F7|nr:uncharacterized protein INS49_015789 [Diaporthe citri]KAG6356401.1 hypothetical protein INS49_015789 [Diaporthe citri]